MNTNQRVGNKILIKRIEMRGFIEGDICATGTPDLMLRTILMKPQKNMPADAVSPIG